MMIFVILSFAWLAAIFVAVAAGKSEAAAASVGAFAIIVLFFGLVTLGISIWFFIEFGCMRGTVGENRFGPDPVR